MLTPELLKLLRSDAGAAALRIAAGRAGDPLRARQALRAFPPALARAAIQQVELRRRATRKFSRAAEMFFTAALLEQASGETIARWRARRYTGVPVVADIGCGLGGDTLALAGVAQVIALDRDPLALALTAANAAALGRAGRVWLLQAAAPQGLPRVPAAFADPSRRPAGRRVRSLAAISPPLAALLEAQTEIGGLGVKLSPTVAHVELDETLGGRPHEREFISVEGECREAVIWLGSLRTAERRASLLPAGISLTGTGRERGEVGPIEAVLYEPDAAVIRAGLVARLAQELGARLVDPQLAYLTAERFRPTPWARAYAIREIAAFSGKALRRQLRELGAGEVVFKTRGVAIPPETLRRQVASALRGGNPAVAPIFFVTRLAGQTIMIRGEYLGTGCDHAK